MFAALTLSLILSQAGSTPPAPWETARLYFLAGDLGRAQELAHGCAARGELRCQRQLELLARYAFLAHRADGLSLTEAADLLALDRRLAGASPGALTRPILLRFVRQPLDLARARLAAGQVLEAWALVAQVLAVDPTCLEAQRFFLSSAKGEEPPPAPH